jgi:hypothetical protein
MGTQQKTRTARGEVIAVQEQFFRIVTETGQGLLFTLSHRRTASAANLIHYRDQRTPVEVEYEGEPGLTSAIAHRVQPV